MDNGIKIPESLESAFSYSNVNPSNYELISIKENIKKKVLNRIEGLEQQTVSLPKSSVNQKNHWKRRILYTVGSISVVFGGLAASGFASPEIAQTLIRIPYVGKVFNLLLLDQFTLPNVKNITEKGYSSVVNQSYTDQGITLTIGNVVADKHQIWFDMVQSYERGNATPKIVKGTSFNGVEWAPIISEVEVNGVKMDNGDIQGGEFQKVQGDHFAGTVLIWSKGQNNGTEFPITSDIKVHVTQFGNVKGNWYFTFKASRQKLEQASKSLIVNQEKNVEGITLKVKKITTDPSSIYIDYSLTQPFNDMSVFFDISVFDENGVRIETAEPTGKPVIHDNVKSWDFQGVYPISTQIPKSITIVPSYQSLAWGISIPNATRTLDQTVFAGTDDELKVTKIEQLPDKTLLHVNIMSDKFIDFNSKAMWIEDLYVRDQDERKDSNGNPAGGDVTIDQIPVTKTIMDNENTHSLILQFPAISKKSGRNHEEFLLSGSPTDFFTKQTPKFQQNRSIDLIPVNGLKIKVPLSLK